MLPSSLNMKLTQSPQNTPASLQVCFGGSSQSGKKEVNQDAFAALVPKQSEIASKGIVAAIADGVSSASKAKEAAQLSVTQFISDYYATSDTWSTRKSAAKVLTSLNQWLYSQSDNSNSHFENSSGQWLTTFSTLIVKSCTAYIFHVGDTRISQYRQNKLKAITRDHNQKQGGRSIVLTRALGADSRLEVDVHQVDVQKNDIYMLTCDGVHEFITVDHLTKLLDELGTTPSNELLEQTSKMIVETAIKNGSDDNVSCLLVHITETPIRDLAEIERDLHSKVIPPALDIGTKLDGYQITKVIHASTRSHLYLVKHEENNTKHISVLKVPSLNFSEDAIYLQGFKREAWVGERIDHPNIMKIKNADSNSRFLYHICEYIDGQTLTDWMHDNPKPSISQVRDIVNQTILALRTFQRLEIVHRDLKPDNIMIDAFGKVTLIDYGTVKIASLEENSNHIEEEVPQGSLNYIAPETLLSLHADYQSDLFSLGVIAYEMLTGALPYKPMTKAEVVYDSYGQWHYKSGKQIRSDLPHWLDMSLQKATHPDPQQRYTSFSEFYSDISRPNTSAIQEYKKQPLMQRNPIQFWQSISGLLFIAFLVALVN